MNPDIHNLIPFTKIEKTIEKIGYGSLDVTLQIHQQKIIAVEGHQFQRVKYPAGQNTEAVSLLLSEIKNLHDNQQTGNFSFSMTLNNGDIREVSLNRNLKESFPLEASVTDKKG